MSVSLDDEVIERLRNFDVYILRCGVLEGKAFTCYQSKGVCGGRITVDARVATGLGESGIKRVIWT